MKQILRASIKKYYKVFFIFAVIYACCFLHSIKAEAATGSRYEVLGDGAMRVYFDNQISSNGSTHTKITGVDRNSIRLYVDASGPFYYPEIQYDAFDVIDGGNTFVVGLNRGSAAKIWPSNPAGYATDGAHGFRLEATIYTTSEGHNWSGWTTTSNPTCTSTGSKYRTCSYCDYKETQSIPANGHSWYWVSDSNATCTTNGSKHQHCSVCGANTSWGTVNGYATGHSFTAAGGFRSAATCTSPQTNWYKCSKCGTQGSTYYSVGSALGHNSNGVWVTSKNPNCTQAGEKHTNCTRCGSDINSTVIPALGHTDNNTWVTSKEPTCTVNGEKHTNCSICGANINSTSIPALGHDTRTEVTNPTCTEEGVTNEICNRCEQLITATPIPALGHDFAWVKDTDPDCTLNGYKHQKCNRCGYEDSFNTPYAEPLGHTPETHVTEPTCTEEGVSKEICSTCGAELSATPIPALGHVWTYENSYVSTNPTTNRTGIRTFVCERDGEHKSEQIEPVLQYKIYVGNKRVKKIYLGNQLIGLTKLGDSNITESTGIAPLPTE